MLAVRIVVGCEILKALDHLENVGLRILVQRRDALRNHGATSHAHRSPRNVVQRRNGGDLVSCRFHFPHSFRRSRCLRPAALTRWRSAGWGGGSKIDGSGAGGATREAPARASAPELAELVGQPGPVDYASGTKGRVPLVFPRWQLPPLTERGPGRSFSALAVL